MRVVDATVTPPGGWRYTEKTTGYVMTSHSLDGLLSQILSHRRANNIEYNEDTWREDIEAELCGDPVIGERNCGEPPVNGKPSDRKIGLHDVKRFMLTINEWMWKTKFAFVDEELADARSHTCANCPKNVEVQGCFGCKGVTSMVKEMLPKERQGNPHSLKSCEVCGCFLPLKVHLPLEVATAAQDESLHFPSHCWMVTEAAEQIDGSSDPAPKHST